MRKNNSPLCASRNNNDPASACTRLTAAVMASRSISTSLSEEFNAALTSSICRMRLIFCAYLSINRTWSRASARREAQKSSKPAIFSIRSVSFGKP